MALQITQSWKSGAEAAKVNTFTYDASILGRLKIHVVPPEMAAGGWWQSRFDYSIFLDNLHAMFINMETDYYLPLLPGTKPQVIVSFNDWNFGELIVTPSRPVFWHHGGNEPCPITTDITSIFYRVEDWGVPFNPDSGSNTRIPFALNLEFYGIPEELTGSGTP
ncbi:MAG: hypothetical protein WC485_00080 [Opitutaceae bacterium]